MSVVLVQCFQCNAVLELDEGFRGGVCRCSTCGSLLQVPRGERAGRKPRPAAPQKHPPAGGASENRHGAAAEVPDETAPPSPENELARISREAALEAMSSSSFREYIQHTKPIADPSQNQKPPKKPPRLAPPPSPASSRQNNAMLWIGIILIGLILAGVVVAVMISGPPR